MSAAILGVATRASHLDNSFIPFTSGVYAGFTVGTQISFAGSTAVQIYFSRDRRRSALGRGHGTVLKSHDLAETDAKAFRTSACEIPNCRAILDGVMPALKAARTAFDFP